MRIHHIIDSPNRRLAAALTRFEEQFSYPLGNDNRFRISHGEDYCRFYRSLGEASCFVAERDGDVLGGIGVALRELLTPSGKYLRTAYIGDLKVRPTAFRGQVLLALAREAQTWVGGRVEVAFGVVMGGSAATPESYTGRAGILPFKKVGEIDILRIPCLPNLSGSSGAWLAGEAAARELFALLSRERYACVDGQPFGRSEIEPQWLCDPTGRACGRLEDTRRAKRLFDVQGDELLSAHLSCFAFDDCDAAARLIKSACSLAAARGFSHLFVAVDDSNQIGPLGALSGEEVQVASAAVYGAGLSPGHWNIHTSEI